MNLNLQESENVGKSIFRIDIRAPASPMIMAVSDKSEDEIHEMVKSLRMKFIEACDATFGDNWWSPTMPEHFLVTSLMHVDPCLTVEGQKKRMQDDLEEMATNRPMKLPPHEESEEGWWLIMGQKSEQIVWAKDQQAACTLATRVQDENAYSHYFGPDHPDGVTEAPNDDKEPSGRATSEE